MPVISKVKQQVIQNFLKTIDMKEGIDIAPYFKENDVQEDKYFIFPTGGPHLLWLCEEEKPGFPYDSFVWPFIVSKRKKLKNSPLSLIWGSIGLNNFSNYVRTPLRTNKPKINRNFTKAKNRKPSKKIKERGYYEEKGYVHYKTSLHKIVAKVYLDGYAPDKVVDHIDGNRVNYMIDNLRWVTISENSFGPAGGRNCYDQVYRNLLRTKWFNGEGVNNIMTAKKEFYAKQKESSGEVVKTQTTQRHTG